MKTHVLTLDTIPYGDALGWWPIIISNVSFVGDHPPSPDANTGINQTKYAACKYSSQMLAGKI